MASDSTFTLLIAAIFFSGIPSGLVWSCFIKNWFLFSPSSLKYDSSTSTIFWRKAAFEPERCSEDLMLYLGLKDWAASSSLPHDQPDEVFDDECFIRLIACRIREIYRKPTEKHYKELMIQSGLIKVQSENCYSARCGRSGELYCVNNPKLMWNFFLQHFHRFEVFIVRAWNARRAIRVRWVRWSRRKARWGSRSKVKG